MRLIVTRPAAQAASWVERLRALGVDARPLPLIEIGAPPDPAAVQRAWQQLPSCALAVFVSPNAAARFLAARPAAAGWPATTLAGATGPGTAGALRVCGVPAAQVVEPPVAAGVFDSEALWKVLRRLQPWAGRRVLVVRGDAGRDWLAEELRAQQASVDFVAAYRRLAPQPDADARALLAAALAAPRDHLWLFSSSEAVGHLAALAPAADWSAARALASHPRIAARARSAGFGQVRTVPPRPADVARAAQGWSIESAPP